MSDNNEKPNRIRLEDIRVGGMTLARLAEIEEAEAEGRELDITDEERAEYESGKAEMREVSSRLMKSYNEGLKGVLNMKGMWDRMDSITKNNPVFSPKPFLPEVARLSPQHLGFSEEYEKMMDSIGEAKREEYERENRNSENIQATAEVMKGMLATMQAESDKAAERDREAHAAAKKNLLVARLSMIFAGLALLVPVGIEIAKLIWR